MSVDLLTLDNPLLSSLTNHRLAHFREVNCTSELSADVIALVREGVSEATRKAYRSDLRHFEEAGIRIPSSASELAQYICLQSSISSVSTIHRRIATLATAHRSLGYPNPANSELVKATLRGLRRVKGMSQRQATPLLKSDLWLTLDATGGRLKDLRDRSLLLLGFAGGLRRSELVGLDCDDLQLVRHGLEITIRRSKTDQEGRGRKIGIPFGRGRWCPVISTQEWLRTSCIEQGPVFRPIDRHNRLHNQRLSGAAVCEIIRERVKAAGLSLAGYSGHSLRSGFATSAAQAGVSSLKIRQQTGHSSDAMLSRYIRDAELFVNNAAGALL